MILEVTAFALIASKCAPDVHIETLTAVAQAESGLNTLAIRDNTERRGYFPKSETEAIETASRLVLVAHHAVDMGLMQISSAHLAPFQMTIADAFDACKNIGAGARVLVGAYKQSAAGEDEQVALDKALSRYNTGSSERGVTNGYVRRVKVAARQVVPAIRLGSAEPQAPGDTHASTQVVAVAARSETDETPPPWDVFGQAHYQRGRGGVVFGGEQR